MKRIAGEIARELGRFGPEAAIAAVVEAWPPAVGAAIARNAWPARLARDGTLHVHASSAAWAFELGQLEPSLRERLGERLGAAAPSRLRFAVGPVPEPSPDRPGEGVAGGLEVLPEHTAAAADLVAGIANEELRESVARAAAASLARGAGDRRFW
jgi:hypothetical protein